MRTAPRLVLGGMAAVVIGVNWRSEQSDTSIFLPTGFPDCEAFRSGWLAQPTLALTSLVFVLLGIWIAGDRRADASSRLLLGATTVGVGVGSFLGHAGTSGTRTVDSVAIKLMLVAFVVVGLRRRQGGTQLMWMSWVGASAAISAAELLWPATGRLLFAVLLVAAGVAWWLRVEDHQRRRLAAGGAVLGLSALIWWSGQGESPLCSPESVLQIHGLWHILSAAGIALAYSTLRSEVT